METVRYNYRLRPGALAVAGLVAEWHRCRFLWNEAVHMGKTGQKPNGTKLCRLLTQARKANSWLRSGSQNAQQNMLLNYGRALDASFKIKGRGKPVVKVKKMTRPSLEYTTNGFSITPAGRLRLPKGVEVPVVWHRDLPSQPSSVRVYQTGDGYWTASFVVQRPKATPTPALTGDGIGIDWGVKAAATTSEEAFDLPALEYRKRIQSDVATGQRKMARRDRGKGKPQSTGYKHAKRQVARVQGRAARQNQHDGRNWAQKLVRQFSLIAIEDFKPRFLAKSTMARKASDIALGALKRELASTAERAGRTVVMVKPAYTTMTCSACFARTKPLGLHERVFRCPHCGYTTGRDRNAARVILAVAERGHDRVDEIRHLHQPPSELVGSGAL